VTRLLSPSPDRVLIPTVPTDFGLRELMAVREIMHAFLTAERPEDDLGNLPIPGDKRPGDADNKKGGAKPDPAKKNPPEDDLLRELEKGK